MRDSVKRKKRVTLAQIHKASTSVAGTRLAILAGFLRADAHAHRVARGPVRANQRYGVGVILRSVSGFGMWPVNRSGLDCQGLARASTAAQRFRAPRSESRYACERLESGGS